jgi:hypothetical protein
MALHELHQIGPIHLRIARRLSNVAASPFERRTVPSSVMASAV